MKRNLLEYFTPNMGYANLWLCATDILLNRLHRFGFRSFCFIK